RGVVPAHRALPLADNAVCRQIEEESLALPGCLFALHAPTAGTKGWSSRREVGGWQGFSSRGGKLGETHQGGLPALAEFLAQIPHPLGKDLPDFLTWRRVGTPPITILLTIFISQHRLETATMQIELDHIGSGEAASGQGSEKELIDALI